MQVVERSALVSYSPAQMFALVNDVGKYPEFLPWCVASRVEDVSAFERLASVKVARGVLKTEFTTREGAEQGALDLKRRFPTLQIRVYDAQTQSRHEIRP